MARLSIVQGEDISITIRLSEEDGDPYDLTGITEITAEIPKTGGGCVSKTYTGSAIAIVSPATSGKITVALTDTDTALLLAGTNSLELTLDFGTTRRIKQFRNQLEILEQIC